MFASFRNFLSELTEGAKPADQFAHNDYRLAAAAMLVHAASIDGDVSPKENAKLHGLLKDRFGLDDAAVDELVSEATEAENEAVDLYRFTSLLDRTLDDEGKRKIVEMLWEVVYADGKANELEDNLLWRAADLLHVPTRDRVLLRQRVAGETAGNDSDQS
jgi:uncharacterized tellurite resistance protein B-like protein